MSWSPPRAQAALTVLRDHIPDGIRDLTISLLTNERAGLKQLEQAVNVLSNTATQVNPGHLEREIETGQKRVSELRKKIKDIDHELGEWANRHLKQIGEGDKLLPMELAQKIVGDRERHTWLPDQPGPESKYDPVFSDEDIAAAREARKALGENLQYLGKELPSLSDLPDTAIITAIHEDLVHAKKLEERANDRNTPVLSLSAERAVERAEKLLDAVKNIAAVLKDLERRPWLFSIVETWRDKGMDTDEVKLFNAVLPTMSDLAKRRQAVVGYAVILPEEKDGRDDLLKAVIRAADGSRPFGLVAIGKSEVRALYKKIRIEGRVPQSAEDWSKVAQTLQWRRDMAALSIRWKAIAAEYDLPPMDDNVDAAGRWLASVIGIIGRVAKILGHDRKLIETEVPDLFPYGMSVADIFGSREGAERAAETININLSKKRLSGSRERIGGLLERLAACSGPIVDAMTDFVTNGVGDSGLSSPQVTDRWQELCRELSTIITLRPRMETVERVAQAIAASGAPNWADALRSEPVTGTDDSWTPGDWRETWNWRRQETYLRQIDGRNAIRELSKRRLQHEDDLRKLFHKVVEKRTFLSLKKSMTGLVETALVMFTAAIRKIGKGTGIRAQRFRRDAREAMERSYSAVPCWIMPTWRVSESLPAVLGSFDLVIVDEASQSDISALPALVRGKKVLIVGDDKQVSPTAAFVEERRLLQLKHNFLQGQHFAPLMLPGGSLYDLAKAMFPGRGIMLHEHFRCVEPIIRFSMKFYTEPIIPLRVPTASERLDPPLIDVYLRHGQKTRGGINIAEADAIVNEIEKIVTDPAFKKRTIGVISLIGSKQAHHIQTQLLARIGEEAYVAHDITCGNPARFQGKERDIMLVSMVESSDTQSAKTALLWEQRFNVAFSRARDRMYLFRSVDLDELRPDDLKARVIHHFKSPMETAVPEVGDLVELCGSGFERDVFRRLRTLGYRVTPQVTAAGYFIDLVVEGDQGRRLAIELDGDQHHPPEQWADDLVRQRTMERMGWRFWRCWGSSFYLDPDACMADLVQALDSRGIKPLGSEVPRNVYTDHRIIEEPATAPIEPEEQPERRLVEADKAPSATEDFVEPVEAVPEIGVAEPLSVVPRSTETQQLELSQPETLTEEEETVEIGDRVLIDYNDDVGRQHTIRISDTEHDPEMQIIGVDYPLAQALLGAAVDEELEISAGGGKRIITVVGIEKETRSVPQTSTSGLSTSNTTSKIERGNNETLDENPAETEDQETAFGERRVPPPPDVTPQLAPSDAPKRLKNAIEFTQSGMEHDTPQTSDRRTEPSPRTNDSQSIRPYKAWDSTLLPDPRGTPLHNIADQMVEIIDVEGPVILERVFHLYARAAGINRVGGQLRKLFLRASEIALTSSRIEEEGGQRKLRLESVVRPIGSQPVILRKRGPRAFEEIPESEIAKLIQSVLATHREFDRETLYRRVLDFYDLKRLTSTVRKSLARILSDEGIDLVEPDTLASEGSPRKPSTQTHSKYQFELLGENFVTDSLIGVLVTVIRTIQDLDHEFLSRLSQKGGRVRPIVAQNPRDLYPGRPDLSHYSREITDGWFVGSNYSKRDVDRILQIVCTSVGLVYGQDLRGPAIEGMKDRLS